MSGSSAPIMPHLVARVGSFYCALLFLALPAGARVVINEIHSNPDVKTDLVEFIELYNTATTAVNLSGWQFTSGVEFRFPENAAISGGGYVVIAQNPAALAAKFGVSALGPWTGSLDNDGEKIVLVNAAGGVEDEVD